MNFLINWELIKVIQQKKKKKGNKNMLEIEFNMLSVHVWVKYHIK